MKQYRWDDMPWYGKAFGGLSFVLMLPLAVITFLPALIISAVSGGLRKLGK